MTTASLEPTDSRQFILNKAVYRASEKLNLGFWKHLTDETDPELFLHEVIPESSSRLTLGLFFVQVYTLLKDMGMENARHWLITPNKHLHMLAPYFLLHNSIETAQEVVAYLLNY